MNLKILPSANEDLINGYHFYEQQTPGLGSYFLNSLFSDIDSLIIYHAVHVKFFDKYYRLLSRLFPFSIYYTVENQDIIIYAVLDCRMNPAWIANRLETDD
ncbi:MAG: type II toxin-antitoxin system RelE/ParE family toxin [Methylococcales bacterium]